MDFLFNNIMESKLELKHLAPYLPYRIKVKWFRQDDSSFQTSDLTISDYNFLTSKLMKPILKPLSDIDKQLILDITEYSDIEDIVFSGNPSDLYFINTEEKTYLSDYLNATEFLYSNHFDVFGLIDKGLAIDINTL